MDLAGQIGSTLPVFFYAFLRVQTNQCIPVQGAPGVFPGVFLACGAEGADRNRSQVPGYDLLRGAVPADWSPAPFAICRSLGCASAGIHFPCWEHRSPLEFVSVFSVLDNAISVPEMPVMGDYRVRVINSGKNGWLGWPSWMIWLYHDTMARPRNLILWCTNHMDAVAFWGCRHRRPREPCSRSGSCGTSPLPPARHIRNKSAKLFRGADNGRK